MRRSRRFEILIVDTTVMAMAQAETNGWEVSAGLGAKAELSNSELRLETRVLMPGASADGDEKRIRRSQHWFVRHLQRSR